MAKTQLDLTQGPIFKRLMLFSLPILLGAVVTEFYNLVDAVIVGRFVGANALAAVSAASPSTNVINMFLIGLQTGASVVVAQKVGAHDRTHLQDAVDTIYALTMISSVILVVGGLLAAGLSRLPRAAGVYAALVGAMLAGRLVSGAVNALIFRAGAYTLQAWIAASFVTALPGIVIQLVAIPLLVAALERAHVITVSAAHKSA